LQLWRRREEEKKKKKKPQLRVVGLTAMAGTVFHIPLTSSIFPVMRPRRVSVNFCAVSFCLSSFSFMEFLRKKKKEKKVKIGIRNLKKKTPQWSSQQPAASSRRMEEDGRRWRMSLTRVEPQARHRRSV